MERKLLKKIAVALQEERAHDMERNIKKLGVQMGGN